MTNADLPFQAMQAGWKYLTKWTKRTEPMTDQDWDDVVAEAYKIWQTSGRNKLVSDVLAAYMEEIERRLAYVQR